jgi:hypothetical protein
VVAGSGELRPKSKRKNELVRVNLIEREEKEEKKDGYGEDKGYTFSLGGEGGRRVRGGGSLRE